jgi:N-acetylneuraminate synthase
LAFGYLNPDETPSLDAFQKAYCSNKGYAYLKNNVTLLHCTTEYPVPFKEVNLCAMETMKSAFGLNVGFSDHTEGIAIPIAAAAKGACIIEKHFTLSRQLPGPDHQASLEPHELDQMVQSIREVEQALGSPRKVPSPSEIKNIQVSRKSLVAGCNIKKGEIFSELNLVIKRPGNGISPMLYWEQIGKQAQRNYETDELID